MFDESNSLDSCLFEIFHSKDVSKKSSPTVQIKRPEIIHTSPPKKMKENPPPVVKSIGKLRPDRSSRKQRDIRYYFKKNSRTKIITYKGPDEIPMDSSPVPFERSGNELDIMDIESPNKDLTEDLSDMEIEHFLKNETKLQNNETKSQKSETSAKISKSLSFDDCILKKVSGDEKNDKLTTTNKKTEEDRGRKSWTVETSSSSSSCKHRERSPLSHDLDKPVKFVRTIPIPLLNSRRVLKPISLRFRRYTSMIEMSSSFRNNPTTPNFCKVQNERIARSEPRNKRKVNPRELFDELDNYDEPSSCKKARKSISISSTLPPPIQRLPLFKPSVESRCYGDADLGVQPLPTTKECESCCTSETLIWRDTEEGVSLCNACGIRWRKYHYRCIECWYIPMQGELDQVNCASCGKYNTLKKFNSFKRHKTSVL